MGFHRQRTMWLWRNPDNVTHRQLLSIDQIWRRSTALTWSRWGCRRLADNIWLLLLAHDNNNNWMAYFVLMCHGHSISSPSLILLTITSLRSGVMLHHQLTPILDRSCGLRLKKSVAVWRNADRSPEWKTPTISSATTDLRECLMHQHYHTRFENIRMIAYIFSVILHANKQTQASLFRGDKA